VFENRVLRIIFGPTRDKLTGEWRKLYNEEQNDLYCTPNIFLGDQIEKIEIGRACRMYGVEERCKQGFGGKT